MTENTVKPIRTEADYEAAVERIGVLMGAEPGTDEFDELKVLADLVELYQSKHDPIGPPSPVEAIEFRMDQAGLIPRDLVPFIGSSAKVSEVLSGKRTITMSMARALHKHLGIPAEVLLRKPESDELDLELEWRRFPVKAMAKRGWIPDVPCTEGGAADALRDLIDRAGGPQLAKTVLYRKSDRLRTNAKTDAYALKAWCWRVLAKANEERPGVRYRRGTVTLDFLRKVARLSSQETGPRLAKELLARHGIPLVVVRRLPKTYLDGAALRGSDGRPVVGLTLRHDRIDSFWFCLLHELAHVGRHLDNGKGDAFVDDLTLRMVTAGHEDPREKEADDWAEEALIPRADWESAAVREGPTAMAVTYFASSLGVHPAVVAGRIRYERENCRLLSQFVGTGTIRPQFSRER